MGIPVHCRRRRGVVEGMVGEGVSMRALTVVSFLQAMSGCAGTGGRCAPGGGVCSPRTLALAARPAFASAWSSALSRGRP